MNNGYTLDENGEPVRCDDSLFRMTDKEAEELT